MYSEALLAREKELHGVIALDLSTAGRSGGREETRMTTRKDRASQTIEGGVRAGEEGWEGGELSA